MLTGLLEKREMDNSPYSMNATYVPSPVLRTLCIFLHLVPTTTLCLIPFPLSIGEATEAQRSKVTCLKPS